MRVAAETASEFGAFDEALKFRQQLLTASAADEENRIELIRLLAVSGKKDEAIQNLNAIIADRDATRALRSQALWLRPEIDGSGPATFEDDALEQTIAMYLKQNQPRAALKMAEQLAKIDIQPSFERYQTLRERAQNRKFATRINLLALLSAAAEQIGDLNRAVELEKQRLALDKSATHSRLDHLQQLLAARTQKGSFIVDQKLTTD